MTSQEQKFERFLKDFEQIINMDSSGENLDGVARVAHFLKEKLVRLGLDVEITRQGEKGVPCLKACTPSRNGRYDFMFLGHMDTVFPAGEAQRRPFSTEGNVAHGPGVNDMQDGLLLAVYVVEALKEEGALEDMAICLAFNGDEETGSRNSRAWIEENAALCDRVLVFEPCRPGFRYVLNRKGGCRILVTTHGISSHAGADPEKGVNAVVELAHQIQRINELNRPDWGVTAQCTVIRGGEKTNIIPHTASVKVDLRYATTQEAEEALAFFNSLPQRPVLPGASVEVAIEGQRPPMESTPESEEMLRILVEEGQKLGLQPAGISTGGCSDGNWTAAMGIPTLDGMGPVGENSHRLDEYMLLDSFIPALTMITALCKRVVSQAR
jgi:glutamate carboxypeptidase